MQVNCLHCGHRFDLGKAYDDYEGAVRCSTCRGLLDIRTQDGQVRAVRPFSFAAQPAPQAAAPAPAPTTAPAAAQPFPVTIPINTAAPDPGPTRLAA